MTVVRGGLFTGLTCGLAAVVWASGLWALVENSGGLDRRTVALGVQGLWTVQAIVLSVLVPWSCIYFGWRDIALGVAVLILATLPLTALSWLIGAADLEALGYGTLLLAVGALGLFAIASGIRLVMPNPSLQSCALATLQMLCATLALFEGSAWFVLVLR